MYDCSYMVVHKEANMGWICLGSCIYMNASQAITSLWARAFSGSYILQGGRHPSLHHGAIYRVRQYCRTLCTPDENRGSRYDVWYNFFK